MDWGELKDEELIEKAHRLKDKQLQVDKAIHAQKFTLLTKLSDVVGVLPQANSPAIHTTLFNYYMYLMFRQSAVDPGAVLEKKVWLLCNNFLDTYKAAGFAFSKIKHYTAGADIFMDFDLIAIPHATSNTRMSLFLVQTKGERGDLSPDMVVRWYDPTGVYDKALSEVAMRFFKEAIRFADTTRRIVEGASAINFRLRKCECPKGPPNDVPVKILGTIRSFLVGSTRPELLTTNEVRISIVRDILANRIAYHKAEEPPQPGKTAAAMFEEEVKSVGPSTRKNWRLSRRSTGPIQAQPEEAPKIEVKLDKPGSGASGFMNEPDLEVRKVIMSKNMSKVDMSVGTYIKQQDCDIMYHDLRTFLDLEEINPACIIHYTKLLNEHGQVSPAPTKFFAGTVADYEAESSARLEGTWNKGYIYQRDKHGKLVRMRGNPEDYDVIVVTACNRAGLWNFVAVYPHKGVCLNEEIVLPGVYFDSESVFSEGIVRELTKAINKVRPADVPRPYTVRLENLAPGGTVEHRNKSVVFLSYLRTILSCEPVVQFSPAENMDKFKMRVLREILSNRIVPRYPAMAGQPLFLEMGSVGNLPKEKRYDEDITQRREASSRRLMLGNVPSRPTVRPPVAPTKESIQLDNAAHESAMQYRRRRESLSGPITPRARSSSQVSEDIRKKAMAAPARLHPKIKELLKGKGEAKVAEDKPVLDNKNFSSSRIVYASDLWTLLPGETLTDGVIDFYIWLIMKSYTSRLASAKKQKVWIDDEGVAATTGFNIFADYTALLFLKRSRSRTYSLFVALTGPMMQSGSSILHLIWYDPRKEFDPDVVEEVKQRINFINSNGPNMKFTITVQNKTFNTDVQPHHDTSICALWIARGFAFGEAASIPTEQISAARYHMMDEIYSKGLKPFKPEIFTTEAQQATPDLPPGPDERELNTRVDLARVTAVERRGSVDNVMSSPVRRGSIVRAQPTGVVPQEALPGAAHVPAPTMRFTGAPMSPSDVAPKNAHEALGMYARGVPLQASQRAMGDLKDIFTLYSDMTMHHGEHFLNKKDAVVDVTFRDMASLLPGHVPTHEIVMWYAALLQRSSEMHPEWRRSWIFEPSFLIRWREKKDMRDVIAYTMRTNIFTEFDILLFPILNTNGHWSLILVLPRYVQDILRVQLMFLDTHMQFDHTITTDIIQYLDKLRTLHNLPEFSPHINQFSLPENCINPPEEDTGIAAMAHMRSVISRTRAGVDVSYMPTMRTHIINEVINNTLIDYAVSPDQPYT